MYLLGKSCTLLLMQPTQSLHTDPVTDELRSLIQKLLDKVEQQRLIIEKQQKEIEALNDEVRHLKKLKGKPRIRPNKPDNPQGSDADEISPDQTEKSETPGNHPPLKAKCQDNQNSGQTSAPERQINHEKVCHLEDVQTGWRNKGYYPELRAVLGKLMVIKESLLRVLDLPWLPLHNNLSERQIREYVKKRKISGGTRSTLWQKCRDTFVSLKKTCQQHGVSFSRYLLDRLSGAVRIPQIAELIRRATTVNNQVVASGF